MITGTSSIVIVIQQDLVARLVNSHVSQVRGFVGHCVSVVCVGELIYVYSSFFFLGKLRMQSILVARNSSLQTILQIGVELLQGVQGTMTKALRSTSKACSRDLILSGY